MLYLQEKKIRGVLKEYLGLDKGVVYLFIARFLQLFGGVLLLLVIPHVFDQREQGYYFTFNSLIALQTVFELGISYVIVQLLSHENAKIKWVNGKLSTDSITRNRVLSLIKFSLTWCLIVSLLYVIILIPLGIYFFFKADNTIEVTLVIIPWFCLVITSGYIIICNMVFAILEGFNKVNEVARLRLMLELLLKVTLIILLLMGYKLYALPLAQFIGLTVCGGITYKKYKHIFYDAFGSKTKIINWKKEIFPFQWRIAVSWFSGYLILQIVTPLLFRYQGPVVAGQMGFSLNILNSITSLGMVWLTMKIPTFGMLIAKNKIGEMNVLFKKTTFISSSFVFFTGICFAAIIPYIPENIFPKHRIILGWPFLLLVLSSFINQIAQCQMAYIRAYRVDPFMPVSILGAISQVTLMYFSAKYLCIHAVCISYLITALIIFITVTSLFIYYGRKWGFIKNNNVKPK